MGDKSSFITETIAAGFVSGTGLTGALRGASVVRIGAGNYDIFTSVVLTDNEIVMVVTPNGGGIDVTVSYFDLAPGQFRVTMTDPALADVDHNFSFSIDKILA